MTVCALSMNLTLVIAKQIRLHGTLAHGDISPYYVWLQKVGSFRKYHPEKHSMKPEPEEDTVSKVYR